MELLFFAALKDHFPQSQKWESGIPTVGDLREQLSTQQPEAAELLRISRFAVNQVIVEDDHALGSSDIVAVLPPSSGG